MTYKVHLDGDNMRALLDRAGSEEPTRIDLFYINDDPATDRSAVRQLEIRVHGAEGSANDARLGRTVHDVTAFQSFSISAPIRTSGRTSPRTPTTIWLIDHLFVLVPAQEHGGPVSWRPFSRTIPQRQKAASFNMDEVLQKMKQAGGSK